MAGPCLAENTFVAAFISNKTLYPATIISFPVILLLNITVEHYSQEIRDLRQVYFRAFARLSG
jgi:hypothetical protein